MTARRSPTARRARASRAWAVSSSEKRRGTGRVARPQPRANNGGTRNSMPQMYYDKDADLGLLKGKKIGIIGFGSQGHAHALNLKDSGCDVAVGLYPGSKSWKAVEDAGLRVGTVTEVAEQSDIVMLLVPDQ